MKDNETKNERENSFEKYIRKKTEFNTMKHLGRPSEIKKRGSSPDITADKTKIFGRGKNLVLIGNNESENSSSDNKKSDSSHRSFKKTTKIFYYIRNLK